MSIEQNEIELKKLLTRVMRDPLQPLQAQVNQTGSDVALVAKELRQLREEDLNSVHERLEYVLNDLQRLRNLAEKNAAAISQPMQSIHQEVAQAAAAMKRLAENVEQYRIHAVQRDANLIEQVHGLATHHTEQWCLTRDLVRDETSVVVEKICEMFESSNAEQEAKLKRLVEIEVSQRIDKLVSQGRWTLVMAAVCAAYACLALLTHPLLV